MSLSTDPIIKFYDFVLLTAFRKVPGMNENVSVGDIELNMMDQRMGISLQRIRD